MSQPVGKAGRGAASTTTQEAPKPYRTRNEGVMRQSWRMEVPCRVVDVLLNTGTCMDETEVRRLSGGGKLFVGEHAARTPVTYESMIYTHAILWYARDACIEIIPKNSAADAAAQESG